MLYLIACIAIVVFDQWFKGWVVSNIAPGTWKVFLPGFLRLTHVRNYGAAFSILQNMRWLFVLITIVFVVTVFWAYLKKKVNYPLGLWSLTALTAGAVGNLIDRLRFGYVVDMFETEFMSFPVFNVADCFITVGGILLCIYLLFIYEKKEPAALSKRGKDHEEDKH